MGIKLPASLLTTSKDLCEANGDCLKEGGYHSQPGWVGLGFSVLLDLVIPLRVVFCCGPSNEPQSLRLHGPASP